MEGWCLLEMELTREGRGGWCLLGGDSIEWVLYKEGSAYLGGGLIERVFILRVVIIMEGA